MEDNIVTARTLLREVSPGVRVARQMVMFLITVGIVIGLILVPPSWWAYTYLIGLGINLIIIVNYVEEGIHRWKERTTTN